MDHIAIMSTKVDLIGAIVAGKKTIESRWYKTKRSPWNQLSVDDWVYFKESGGLITARAQVKEVMQYEMLTIEKARNIVEVYGKDILIQDKDVESWATGKNYVILIFLKNPQKIDTPFNIDKTGFGSAAAWLAVGDIWTRKVLR